MKKLLVITALMLCLCLLAGCGLQAFLHETAEKLHNARSEETVENLPAGEEADSASDALVDDPLQFGHAEGRERAEEEEEEDSASDAVSEPPAAEIPPAPEEEPDGFTALSLEECVEPAEGTDGRLPHLLPDCPGAADINDDISGTFRHLLSDDVCTLYYYASKDGSILSVVVVELFDGDASYYTPYLLDLSTGERIGGRELLAYLDLDPEEVAAAELSRMAEEFEHLYGGLSEGELSAFYREQYDHTTAAENAELDRLWLDNGMLYFTANIYSMAGPEFLEYPMPTGYSYSG